MCDFFRKNRIKNGDYVIAAVILLCAGLLSLLFFGRSTPRTLEITVNGAETAVYTLPLSGEYRFDALPYPCVLKIDGYTVSLQDTTCPGHDCEYGGAISAAGETIVCLPNRMLLVLAGGPEIDAVVE